jgi:hypothetical protein
MIALEAFFKSETRGFHPNSTFRYSEPRFLKKEALFFRKAEPIIEGKPSLKSSASATDPSTTGLVGIV